MREQMSGAFDKPHLLIVMVAIVSSTPVATCRIHETGMILLPHSITSSDFLKRLNTWPVSTGRTQQMAYSIRPYEEY